MDSNLRTRSRASAYGLLVLRKHWFSASVDVFPSRLFMLHQGAQHLVLNPETLLGPNEESYTTNPRASGTRFGDLSRNSYPQQA